MTEHGTRTLEYNLHGLETFSTPAGKTGVKGNLQKYVLVPFDESLIYVYGFVTCLACGTISLRYHIETSGDPSRPRVRSAARMAWEKLSIRAAVLGRDKYHVLVMMTCCTPLRFVSPGSWGVF